MWNPTTDKFTPKEIVLHNGRRERGDIKQLDPWYKIGMFGRTTKVDPPPLRTRVFQSLTEISVEALEDLWEDTPKTLRSGLSRTYQLYEPCGLLTPLLGQARAALHEIVLANENNWETDAPEHLWKYLLKCIYRSRS